MTPDAEAPPVEEPDTPSEEVAVTFPELVKAAGELADMKRELDAKQKLYDRVRGEILELMQQVPNLHGVRLPNGDAVRLTWTTSQSKVDPAKLREVLADAPNYIVEVVDAKHLAKDYATVWHQMAKVKSKRTVAVRLAGEKSE